MHFFLFCPKYPSSYQIVCFVVNSAASLCAHGGGGGLCMNMDMVVFTTHVVSLWSSGSTSSFQSEQRVHILPVCLQQSNHTYTQLIGYAEVSTTPTPRDRYSDTH